MSMKWLAVALIGHVLGSSVLVEELPQVVSAELIAQFVANERSLTLGSNNEVVSWSASNDASIVLAAAGTDDPGNIVFDPAALGGRGSLIVRDFFR